MKTATIILGVLSLSTACFGYLTSDFDRDGIVDFRDFGVFAGQWLEQELSGYNVAVTIAAYNAPAEVKRLAQYVCDGVDDNVQIQAAIDDLPTIEYAKRGKITLSVGTYKISSTIYISGKLQIEGSGVDITRLDLIDNANCNMFEYCGPGNEYFFTLKELTMRGNKDKNIQGIGLAIGTGSGNLYDVYLEHVYIYGFAEDGIKTSCCWGHIYRDCIVEYNGGNGVTVSNSGGSGLKIIGCKLIVNYGYGLDLDGPYNAIITDNELAGGENHFGLYIHNGAAFHRVSNCVFSGGGDNCKGIRIEGNRNLILGCYINGGSKQIYGIHIAAGADNQIIGNMIKNCVISNIGDSGTSTEFTNNYGYRVEQAGEVSFNGNGSSKSFIVAHRLAATPAIVVITPSNENMQDMSGEYYISAKSPTEFAITFKTSPSKDRYSFCWYERR